MRIVYNKIIPFKGFLAINLFGILFVRSDASRKLSDVDINHESIHTAQMHETLYIGFYIWYLIEWLIRLLCTFNFHKAYRSIGFEKEAYQNEDNLSYLNSRKYYSWIKLI